MAYLALARKYRPQVFDDIIGQEHVTKTLKNAIETDRVHHAYLFTGIRGVGKTTAARVLAKALNCEKGPTITPCNECTACLEITRGADMDVLEIDAASNRGIDDIRELRETVRYSTARERFRVVIIDEVHMLTEAAFNALLKTLEEPPAHVRFILATTDPQKVPATILSRCQRFDFRRVDSATLIAHLARLCTAEEHEVEEAALRIVVRESGGSVRDALSLLDQLLAAAEGPLSGAQVGEILGVANRAWVQGILEAIFAADTPAALRIMRDVYMTGYDLRSFLLELVQSVRDMVVLTLTGGDAGLVDRSPDDIEKLRALATNHSAHDLDEYFRILLDGTEQIRQSEFPHFVTEEIVLRLCNLRQTVDIAALVGRLEALEKRLREGATDDPSRKPATVEESGLKPLPQEPSPDPLTTLLALAQERDAMKAGMLTQCEICFPEPGCVEVRLAAASVELLDKAWLTGVAVDALGAGTTVTLIETGADVLEDSVAVQANRELEEETERRKDAVREAPLVKVVKDLFGAEVADIRLEEKNDD